MAKIIVIIPFHGDYINYNQKRSTKTQITLLNDLDVTHLTYFAAKIYLKVNSQIAFTTKLRTPRVQIILSRKGTIISKEKSKKTFFAVNDQTSLI